MRLLLLLLLCPLALASSGYRYGVPDYPTMYRDADVVAVVRFEGLRDTQNKKELNDVFSRPTGLHFREIRGIAKIVSLLKGDLDAKAKLVCRFYRFPTLEESSVDLGDFELARKRLAACIRNFGKIHVFKGPPSEVDRFEERDFLVYLKKAADGCYVPVTGDADSDSAVRELTRPQVPIKLSDKAERDCRITPAESD